MALFRRLLGSPRRVTGNTGYFNPSDCEHAGTTGPGRRYPQKAAPAVLLYPREAAMADDDRVVQLKSSKIESHASEMSGPAPSYADNTPLDRVQYLEAKLILKPDPYTSVQSFRDFGKIVRRTAKQCGVNFIEDKKTTLRPEIREVIFLDTSEFALYSNSFILRRRTSYVDGFPVGDPEIVFKFRHPDERKAAAVDVRPQIEGKYRIKFKAEVLPLKDRAGGRRLLYSHSCQFGFSQVREQARSMAMLDLIFPALAKLARSGKERVKLVNEAIVEEVLLPLGQLDFGKGVLANCDIALWRTRGEHLPLVGEFSFQLKFEHQGDVAAKPRKLADEFYVTLQREIAGWLALGVTKTAMVYRLKGVGPQSHE
jgi:hypothetical protein